jgi:hypothetical protein
MGASRGTREIPAGLKKDWRKLAEAMRDVGWTFEQADHPKCFAPDGRARMMLSKTPGDIPAWRNARAAFRRWCRQNEIEPGI